MNIRLPLNADSISESAEYFRNRGFQLLAEGIRWTGKCEPLMWKGECWGLRTYYQWDEDLYNSIYVFKSHRRKGHFTRALKSLENEQFLTTLSCDVFDILDQYVHVELDVDHLYWSEYRIIEQFYGDRRANRSGVWLMNHIDEGVAILNAIGASSKAQAGFMLHPLQRDEDLTASYRQLGTDDVFYDTPSTGSLLLAMEYRNIANQFLSPMENHPGYKDSDQIKLSPLSEVNEMLIADKVQNYKEFELYHSTSHPRRDWLRLYFGRWLERLGIDEIRYRKICSAIAVPQPMIASSIEL